MRKGFIFSVLILFSFSFLLLAAPKPIGFPRYPALSPDGKMLAFSYQGDIFLVPKDGGRAFRLTVSEGYEKLPRFSPDGKWIAFTSDRYGNDDVFIIPAEGGLPKRLTYFSGSDQVVGFTPDSKWVIFTSRRDFSYHRLPLLYKVSIDGGMPVKLVPTYAVSGSLSPDGKKLVFSVGGGSWWRKHYRGAAANELWLYDFTSDKYTQLTKNDWNEFYPMFAPSGDKIYYLSEEDGTFNIWSLDLNSGRKRKLTNYKDDGVRFPSISADGRFITYERRDKVYVLDTKGGKPKEVSIFVPADYKKNPIEWKTFTRDASEFKLSPDGKMIAFVVHGDIFVMDKEGGEAQRITDDPAREYQIDWSPDSKSLVFVSLKKGNADIYLVTSADPKEPRLDKSLKRKIIPLATSEANETSPLFSPDGKLIAFVRGNGDLCVMDKEGKNLRTLIKGWAMPSFSFSPDSKWIAFSRADNEFNNDVWIIPVAGGKPVNITKHPDNDINPIWSPEGRRIAFVSRRIGDTFDIWYAFLRKEDEEKTKKELKEEFKQMKKEKAKKPSKVKIDFKDITLRLHRVMPLPGDESELTISPTGEYYAFRSDTDGGDDLYIVKFDGTGLKRLTRGKVGPRGIQWSKDGKRIYFLDRRGTIKVASINGGVKPVGFSARLVIDHRRERLAAFDEAWAVLNARFYDPKFHGVDWKRMKEKYRPWVFEVSHSEDFYDLIRLMIGELNASHLGIRGPRKENVQTGMLGVIFDEKYRGPGLRIDRVVPKTPADMERSRLYSGEIILEVNGKRIGKNANIYSLLADTVGKKVLLKVKSKDGKEREVVIIPASYSSFRQALYDWWVDRRRKLVHKLSGGRLGYIHIQAMNVPSLERFEMELYSEAHGKDGLVVDVRNNGGGWTTDYLLAMLMVKRHAITIPRDGEPGYPQDRLPLYAWTKPAIFLCNEFSFSNAEIFSHAVKTLKRGKLVGWPTYGAVISTGGTTLIDGSYFRIPFRGWYVKGSMVNMEHNGAVPDIIVQEPPGDEAKGIDRQLERAVKELLAEIRKGK